MGNIARSAVAEATLLPHRSFTAEGDTYLYAAETGGLFRMDDGVRDALSALSSSDGPGGPSAEAGRDAPGSVASAAAGAVPAEILSDLRRAGLLQAAGGCRPADRSAHPPLRLRTLVLMLTTSCNLACRYCYEGREEGCAPPGDGQERPGAVAGGEAPREMSRESLRRGVAYLLDHAGVNRNVSVTFFGGEPLLRFPLIRTAVGEARRMARERGKEISFSITTNGTLLTREIAGFLKENGVSVCLSIDGPREIHDRNRPYASGRGSYGDVARGIGLLM